MAGLKVGARAVPLVGVLVDVWVGAWVDVKVDVLAEKKVSSFGRQKLA